MPASQPLLFPVEPPKVSALDYFDQVERGERGAIYTRREVAEFVLDLVGYVPSRSLRSSRLLEPSCGAGDFLIPAVERLMAAFDGKLIKPADIQDSIRAVDVHGEELNIARNAVKQILRKGGMTNADIALVLDVWFCHGDFLVTEVGDNFSHVVGNPPYIRQESIPDELMAIYRSRFSTIYDRADLYIPFFEKGLNLLAEGGKLGFICSDRWMKNRYGGPLREMVAGGFHLESYVDFTDCPAFHTTVVAYPAVTIISRTNGKKTRAAYRPEVSDVALRSLASALSGKRKSAEVSVAENVANGSGPWLLENFERLNVIRTIESQMPNLEQAGCQVGIGVATGADRVFIAPDDELDVEPSRKLPLVTTKDIESGEVNWRGLAVLNPFGETGKVVSLHEYPKFENYLRRHEELIRRRNVSRRNPASWFRTIDRIYPQLSERPKLLIPDIKGTANIVFEEGKLYPHHNLYYIVSETWDLRALQAVLLSRVAHAFIATYSLKMRGEFLRFQAQYLRRIRIPQWNDVPATLRKRLRTAAISRDMSACDRAVKELYQLENDHWDVLVS